jgi:hypothetical protein
VINFINEGNKINATYPDYTPMELAIRYNRLDIIDILIKNGADINYINHNITPIFLAIIYGNQYKTNEIFKTLLDKGAIINFRGPGGTTPFILACKTSNTDAAMLLFKSGADYQIKDQFGNDFMYYVLRSNDPNMVDFFVSEGFTIPRIYSLVDGPYIRWLNDFELEINQMRYDSLSDKAEWDSKIVNIETIPDQALLKDINFSFNELPDPDEMKYEFRKVKNIFIVSDLHGHYSSFVNLLINNKVLTENLDWNWGNGHLVIAGDVFDRGSQVTECLWLIYKIEHQAKKSGGLVHYLLGNHELMILHDHDKSYVNDKYILPYAKAGINYAELFENETELGHWLRSKNIAVKINDHLIVHGGIPPEFVDIRQSISNMNQMIHDYLSDEKGIVTGTNYLAIEPAWYRGYFSEEYESGDLKKLRKYYDVKNIIVGHTPVDKISSLHDETIIAVGIHFDGKERLAEGLLINERKYTVTDELGNQSKLKKYNLNK